MADGIRPNTEHTTALPDLARESGLVYLAYLPAPSFGTLFILRMKERRENLLARLRRISKRHPCTSQLETPPLSQTESDKWWTDHADSNQEPTSAT